MGVIEDHRITTKVAGHEIDAASVIVDNLDIWTSAIRNKSSAGRGGGSKRELYGIKKLRELILELAVRGLLVPQDPNDETAEVLAEKLAAEKDRLIKEGKIKKSKPLPSIAEEEEYFPVPKGWSWVRIQDIGHDLGQTTPSEEFTYIDVSSINKNYGSIENPSILSASDAPSRARKNVKKGTVIYSTVRPYLLNIAVISDDFTPLPIASTAFAVIHPLKGVSAQYVYRYLRSPTFIKYVESVQTGIAYPAINDKQFFSGLIALPPEQEQQRIVAKVDELMALCDQLEQQTEASLTAHATLVEALLGALTNAVDHDSFQQAWQRIAQHFDTLFTTEQSIDQLKQTILQLAVMGKLTPQDPNDEPASELLKKIANKKAKLVKEGKIKKQKPAPLATNGDNEFDLPVGWEWTTLSQLGSFSGGKTPSKAKPEFWGGNIPWVTPKDMKVELIFNSEDHVTDLALDSGLAIIEPMSLLFVVRSGILRRKFPVAIANVPCTVNQDLKVLSLAQKELANYLLVMMKGFERHILKNLTKTGTTVESLRFEDFAKHYFMLPPREEQNRIVAKVDELMALCDQLKARLNEAQTTQLQLADAIAEQTIA